MNTNKHERRECGAGSSAEGWMMDVAAGMSAAAGMKPKRVHRFYNFHVN
jgi:hypothetical protein